MTPKDEASAASKARRAEARMLDSERVNSSGSSPVPDEQASDGNGPPQEPRLRAVALIPDEGGYRVLSLAMPLSALEAYTVHASEPEVLVLQLDKAHEVLEDAARGVIDAEGNTQRKLCPVCGAAAMVTHPSKPCDICTSCNVRVPHG